MDDDQREQLIAELADDMEQCWEFSNDAFIIGFEFSGFGNMTDDELIAEGKECGWEEDEWFQKILLAYEISKEIAK